MRTRTGTRTRRALASLAGGDARWRSPPAGRPPAGALQRRRAPPGRERPCPQRTVRFTFFGSAEEKPVWDKISEQFGARTPGVQVIPEHVPAQYFTKITAAVAGGDSADVILMEDKPTSGYAKQGYFRELDGFIGTDRTFKYEDYYPGLFEGLKFRGQALRAAPALADPLHLLQQGRLRPGRVKPPGGLAGRLLELDHLRRGLPQADPAPGGETTQWGFPLRLLLDALAPLDLAERGASQPGPQALRPGHP